MDSESRRQVREQPVVRSCETVGVTRVIALHFAEGNSGVTREVTSYWIDGKLLYEYDPCREFAIEPNNYLDAGRPRVHPGLLRLHENT